MKHLQSICFAFILLNGIELGYAQVVSTPDVKQPELQKEGYCSDGVEAPSEFGVSVFCRHGKSLWTPPKDTRFVLVQICGGGSGGFGVSDRSLSLGPGGNGIMPQTILVALRDDAPVEIEVGSGGNGVARGHPGAGPEAGKPSHFGDYLWAPGAPTTCPSDGKGLYGFACIPGGVTGKPGENSLYAKGGASGNVGSDWDGKHRANGGNGGGAGWGPGGDGGDRCSDVNKVTCAIPKSIPGKVGGACAGGGSAGNWHYDGDTQYGVQKYAEMHENPWQTESGAGGDGRIVVIPVVTPAQIARVFSTTLDKEPAKDQP